MEKEKRWFVINNILTYLHMLHMLITKVENQYYYSGLELILAVKHIKLKTRTVEINFIWRN